MKNLFFFLCLPLIATQLWVDAMTVEVLLYLGKWGVKPSSGLLFCDADGNWTFQFSKEVNVATKTKNKKGETIEVWGRRTRQFTIPIHQFGISNYDAVAMGLEHGTFKGNPLLKLEDGITVATETDLIHSSYIPLVKAVFPGQGQITYNENAIGGSLAVDNSIVLKYTKTTVNGMEKITVTYCNKPAIIDAIENGDSDLSHFTGCVEARYQEWLTSVNTTKDRNMAPATTKKESAPKVQAVVYDDMFDEPANPAMPEPVEPPTVETYDAADVLSLNNSELETLLGAQFVLKNGKVTDAVRSLAIGMEKLTNVTA